MNNTISQTNIKINPLILGIMNENNSLKLEILNYLVYLSTRFRFVFPSQGTIAAKFGVTRTWVNALLAEWKALGVINYRQQGYNRSCIYFFNPLLEREKHRIKFKLPAVALVLSLSSLCSAVFQGEFALSNIKNYLYKNNNNQIIRIPNKGYDFYEEGYGKETENILFFNNQSITIEISRLCPKEMVMSQQAIISLISQAYNLSPQQEEQLSRYSFEALEYARKELYRQKKQQSLLGSQAATSWFSAVASGFEKKRAHHSLNGKEVGHSAQQRNPGGHSPAGNQSNLTHDERIEYASNEESAWEEIIEPTPSMESLGLHMGYIERVKSNWKRIGQSPQEFPTSSNRFKDDIQEAECYTEGLDYEEHLNKISADKSDPEAYKRLVRKCDYRRMARK